MNQCSHAECCEDAYCKGLCKRHYHRIAIANWRKKNPHKKYPVNKSKARASDKRWRDKNPDKVIAKSLKWYRSNIDRCRARACDYARRMRIENPERMRELDKNRSPESKSKRRLKCSEYGKKNKHKKRSYSAKRRASKIGVDIGDGIAIQRIYERASFLRSVGFNVVVDHKTPLSKGGKHCSSNLQIIPQSENNRKYCNENFKPIFIFP